MKEPNSTFVTKSVANWEFVKPGRYGMIGRNWMDSELLNRKEWRRAANRVNTWKRSVCLTMLSVASTVQRPVVVFFFFNEGITMCLDTYCGIDSYVSRAVCITQGNYIGYMFRLLNSHLQACSLQLRHSILWLNCSESHVCVTLMVMGSTSFETKIDLNYISTLAIPRSKRTVSRL